MILKINDRILNREISKFNKIAITMRYDSVGSTFGLSYLFKPDDKDNKDFSVPGHIHECTIEHNGQLLLTGYILSHKLRSTSSTQLAQISGYSKSSVIEDCQIPTSVYPLQSDNLCLREIAQKFLKPFGIQIVIDPSASVDMEKKYDTTEAKETQAVKNYLNELASERNIILSHNQFGNLVFTKATSSSPIFTFTPETKGVLDMGFDFNGQGMHSDITVLAQADKDDVSTTVPGMPIKNPYVPFVYRPRIETLSSGKGDDVLQAAKNLLAAELSGMSWTIELSTLQLNGKVPSPGQNVMVTNKEVYLFKPTLLKIESVALKTDGEDNENMILTLVIPEVYTGAYPPKYIFQGINLR